MRARHLLPCYLHPVSQRSHFERLDLVRYLKCGGSRACEGLASDSFALLSCSFAFANSVSCAESSSSLIRSTQSSYSSHFFVASFSRIFPMVSLISMFIFSFFFLDGSASSLCWISCWTCSTPRPMVACGAG